MTVVTEDTDPANHDSEDRGSDTRTLIPKTNFLHHITVEPLAFLVYFGNLTQLFIIQNLVIERVCIVNKGYPPTECPADRPPADVQSHAADIIMYSSLLETFPGIILALCFGPWSDRKGRKIPILYNVLGSLLSSIILLIIASQENLSAEMILIASAIRGVSGSNPIFHMGIYSYISDLASRQERTMRNGILDASILLGVALGMLLSGVVLNAGGYMAVFGLSTVSIGLALIYGVFRLKRKIAKKPFASRAEERENFLEHVKYMYKVMWEKSTKWKVRMSMYTLAICGFVFATNGLETVILMYTRTRFNWDAGVFTKFSTVSLIIRVVGTIGVIGIFSRWLKISDSIIASAGALVAMLGSLISSFMDKGWVLFITGALMQSGNVATAISRSAISKMVSEHELGHIFSLVASVEACVPLFASPIYTSVYDGTKDHFIGAIFIVSSTIQLMTAAIFAIIFFVKRKDTEVHEEDVIDIEEVGQSSV